MKVGRNDPCPCGSGKKYKHCCLQKEAAPAEPAPREEPEGEYEAFKRELQSRVWSTLEEAQAFADQRTRALNLQPLKDFHGLSPDQMQRLLYHPWESPDLVEFPSRTPHGIDAPIMTLFLMLAQGAARGDLKATVRGNLPRRFVRDAALAYWGEEEYREATRRRGITGEADFADLYTARMMSGYAGLIRLRQGRFRLTRRCEALWEEPGRAGLYPLLFKAFCGKYNWAFRDRYPALDIIQYAFAFTLYLLQKHGGEWRPHDFYERAFMTAFPMAVREAQDCTDRPREEIVQRCYGLRCLRRFAGFLGLAEIRMDSPGFWEHRFQIRKRPLLDEAVIFHVRPEEPVH